MQHKISQQCPRGIWASDSLECGSVVCQNFNDMAGKDEALPWISEPMSYILSHVLNITWYVLIAKWDWCICCDRSVIIICPRFSGALELQPYANNSYSFATNILAQEPNIAWTVLTLNVIGKDSVINWSNDRWPGLFGAPEFWSYSSKSSSFGTNM